MCELVPCHNFEIYRFSYSEKIQVNFQDEVEKIINK